MDLPWVNRWRYSLSTFLCMVVVELLLRKEGNRMTKISLKYFDKINRHEKIAPEVKKSLKLKRKGLQEKIKIIDSILAKPILD